MTETLNLQFAAGTKEVKLRTVISKALLRDVEPYVNALREVGQNTAFVEAMSKNPAVLQLVTAGGGINGTWKEDRAKALRDAYPDAPDSYIEQETMKQFGALMSEEFADVWLAMLNPKTTFTLDDTKAQDAVIGIIKCLIDMKQITASDKEEMDAEGFWDEQDIAEMANVVRSFRSIVES